MRRKDEGQEEHLETIQKSIEEAAGKVAHSTKKTTETKSVKQTPGNVRIREEAAAKCTQVVKTEECLRNK